MLSVVTDSTAIPRRALHLEQRHRRDPAGSGGRLQWRPGVRFDNIIQVLSGGKYATSETATWGEGDWNSNDLFDFDDFDDIFDALVTGN